MTPPPKALPEPAVESMREFAQALAEGLLPGLIEAVRGDSLMLLEATRDDAAKHHQEILAKFEERVEVVAPPGQLPPTVSDDDIAAARLVLMFDTWRTMLGRSGAASVFLAERVEKGHGDQIRITHAPFRGTRPEWTLVAIDMQAGELRAALPAAPGLPVLVTVDGLTRTTQLARLEIRDERGLPRWMGLGPALGPPPRPPADNRNRSDG